MAKNEPSFSERLKTSAAAKASLLARAKARAVANAPEIAERQAQRAAVSKAREQRQAERTARKAAEAVRWAKEMAEMKLAKESEAEAEKVVQVTERDKLAADALALKAKQKTGRDAKYAARKARHNQRNR